jgi:hypothetical protein
MNTKRSVVFKTTLKLSFSQQMLAKTPNAISLLSSFVAPAAWRADVAESAATYIYHRCGCPVIFMLTHENI